MRGCWVSEANARDRISALSSDLTFEELRRASRSRTPLAGQFLCVRSAALAQDRELQGRVRRGDVDLEPAFEPFLEPAVKERHGGWRAIRGEHQLCAAVDDRIDRVEELLGGLVLSFQELDVLEQQDVHLAVAPFEGRQVRALEGGHELAGERLRRRVADLESADAERDVVADRLDEVRLADACVAIDEERVVCLAGELCDGQAGGMGKAVAAARSRSSRTCRRTSAPTAPRAWAATPPLGVTSIRRTASSAEAAASRSPPKRRSIHSPLRFGASRYRTPSRNPAGRSGFSHVAKTSSGTAARSALSTFVHIWPS